MSDGLLLFTLLILCQLGLVLFVPLLSALRSGSFAYRWINSFHWFGLFYTLWFIVPQIYFVWSGGFLVGFEGDSQSSLLMACMKSQGILIVFLGLVVVGSQSIRTYGRKAYGEHAIEFEQLDTTWHLLYAILCLVAGSAANLVLGKRNMELEGMRSELVKTTDGMILTAIGFLGAYGFVVLFSDSLRKRHYLLGLVILLLFAAPIFLTGSRARFLWPLVIAIIYYSCQVQRSITLMHVFAGVLCIAAILFSDRLLKEVRGVSTSESKESATTELFERRNFDGFANFTMIANRYQAPARPEVLWFGARDTFMNYFFRDYYLRGVGFGATQPGAAYIGGGMLGVCLLGWLLGVLFGTLDTLVIAGRSPSLLLLYLFAMPWLCAVGGNFVESSDKMLAACFPAFCPLLASISFHSLRRASSF